MQNNIVTYLKTIKSRRLLLCALMLFVSSWSFAETYTVNFKDTDIQEVIRFVASSTGKTIVVDPKVKGKVRVVSSKPVNERELYDLFLSVLSINGFAAVDAGGIVRVVPSRSARSQPVPVYSGSDNTSDKTGYMTQVIQVENVEASKLIPVLRPLVPAEAHLAAYSDSNVIVVTDTASNIQRIRRVIQRLDSASSEDTEVIRLHNASANEAVKTLETLQNAQLGNSKKGSRGSSLQNQAQLVADLRTNSILVTGPKVARDRIRVLATRIDRPVEYLGGAKVIRLKHATAKDLVAVLTKVAESNNTKESRKTVIQADEATNAVILSGSADVVQTLTGVVNQLDVQRAQVLIEAIIVEVHDGDAKQLGVDWLFADADKGFGTSGGSASASILAGASATKQVVNDQGKTQTVSDFGALGTAIGAIANPTFGAAKLRDTGMSFVALLNALQKNTESNILSTPSILTLDNNEAQIVVGEEVPFVTGSYTSTGNAGSSPSSPFQTISRENVGITLKVTPHIGQDGNITMDILQEVSSVSPSSQASDVITNERKIETSVSTQDGQIVVLGGLVKDEVTETQTKVPFLGDIPILGRLFKSNSSSLGKNHLMVFIRPTIVNSKERLTRVSKNRYETIRHTQYHKKEDGVALYDKDVSPMLPNYTDQLNNEQQIRTRHHPPITADQINRATMAAQSVRQQGNHQNRVVPEDQLKTEFDVPQYTPPKRSLRERFNAIKPKFLSKQDAYAPAPADAYAPRIDIPEPISVPEPVRRPRASSAPQITIPNTTYKIDKEDLEPIVAPRGNDNGSQKSLDELYRELGY